MQQVVFARVLCGCQKLLLLLWMSIDLFNAFNFQHVFVPFETRIFYSDDHLSIVKLADPNPSSIHNLLRSSSKFIWCENDSVCLAIYFGLSHHNSSFFYDFTFTSHEPFTKLRWLVSNRWYKGLGEPEENFFGRKFRMSVWTQLILRCIAELTHTVTRISLFRLWVRLCVCVGVFWICRWWASHGVKNAPFYDLFIFVQKIVQIRVMRESHTRTPDSGKWVPWSIECDACRTNNTHHHWYSVQQTKTHASTQQMELVYFHFFASRFGIFISVFFFCRIHRNRWLKSFSFNRFHRLVRAGFVLTYQLMYQF